MIRDKIKQVKEDKDNVKKIWKTLLQIARDQGYKNNPDIAAFMLQIRATLTKKEIVDWIKANLQQGSAPDNII
ncbi:MAG: hypothetical protein ACTSRP_02150 [Candidatus Helarchaeota archaeon]